MPRILCVEDDAETASLLAEALVDLGYTVERASDGEAGLSAIQMSPPDLVLCDVRMPGMNGLDLLEQLAAAAPHLARIPFVFLTALDDRDSEIAARRKGADDYLTKPIDFEMLAVVVEHRLRAGRGGQSQDAFGHLTGREREVLTWASRGKTSAEIALILDLRERTVNFHFDQAMKRLNVVNRTHAVARALSLRLID
ncbi:response regulator transcription factor [Methylobacterium radiotolerans]|uniref:Two component transcriptional regulator, LuxR family n=1 Tax=Methylobacterium radiotolerans (strain ATCC 27329 / DSM 1819 / JCM 2831 / NBRC 15690 / NCIMB 10815 / 0-1) TaxID=426355 RepID=B1M717_METRJ|nr:response regulator transcription factor [Methylobacterium radiotolerans]ACB26676.1 two component transcriptional regulator, LuxR family [Methylobacterium radiotolerans JCM 2831]GEM96563.1 DNA-binding response regulator [Methylobacterium radiotolerans]